MKNAGSHLATAAVVVGLAVAGWAGFRHVSAVHIERGLPDIPQPSLTETLPQVRTQLENARRHALADRTDATANGALGMVLHAYREYAPAAVCYQRAHRLAPRDPRWTYLLALTQDALGLHEAATGNLEKTLELEPDYLPARLRLAALKQIGGDLDASLALYRAAVQQDGSSPQARYGYGSVLAVHGDLAGALEHLRHAVDLAADYGAAHYALASVYRDMGDAQRSEQHLRRHAQHRKTAPAMGDPWQALVARLDLGVYNRVAHAQALGNSGKHQEAVEQYEEIVQLDPGNAVAHTNLITGYASIGRIDKAREQYLRALALFPDWAEAHYLYGRALIKSGDIDAAVDALNKAVAREPHYPDAHFQLGRLMERRGERAAAMHHYRQAITSEPGHRPSHLFLGMLLAGAGETGDAEQHFDRAFSVEDNETPLLRENLAKFYLDAGDFAQSEVHLKHGIESADALGMSEVAVRLRSHLARVRRAARQ